MNHPGGFNSSTYPKLNHFVKAEVFGGGFCGGGCMSTHAITPSVQIADSVSHQVVTVI